MRFAIVVVLAGCMQANAVTCPSGLVCPDGFECRVVHDRDRCTLPAEVTACNPLAEGDPCGTGLHCYDGVCATLCGDGVKEEAIGEACDDGNRDPQDGCSPTCHDEGCGGGEIDGFLGEDCDNGDVISGDGCSSTCEFETPGWSDIPATRLTPRSGMTATLDTKRGEIVAFGGVGASFVPNDETWIYDGRGWHGVVPPHSPSRRQRVALAFEASTARVVLFGGYGLSGLLNDTWVWDGITWRELPMQNPPSRRFNATMAYDAAHGRLELFGGENERGEILSDMWELEGDTWVQNPDPHSLVQSGYARIAFDPVTQQLVMCIPLVTTMTFTVTPPPAPIYKYWVDTGKMCPGTEVELAANDERLVAFSAGHVYEWTAGNWLQKDVTGGPELHVVSFASTMDRLFVLFGGFDGSGEFQDETRLFSDRWLDPTSRVGPQGATRGAVAYDARRGRAIVIGDDAKQDLGVWAWDAKGWTSLGSSPVSPRIGTSVAYHDASDALVLVGGLGEFANPLGDSWVYRDGVWTQLASGPPARFAMAMAYDAKNQKVIAFGGSTSETSPANAEDDTWAFDGTEWSIVNPPGEIPYRRRDASIAYDRRRDRIVMFGGAADKPGGQQGEVGVFDDTWEWTGTAWSRVEPTRRPPARERGTLVYDPLRRVLVLFGGDNGVSNGGVFDDRWEYDGVSWTEVGMKSPLPITQHIAFYDNVREGIVAFGGKAAIYIPPTYTTRILRFESSSPRETCQLADEDRDGDGKAGCDDPDCFGRCTPTCDPDTTCPTNADRCGDGFCHDIEDYAICPADCQS